MVRYWMHNNMLTVNGQKMGKSYGNFITLEELFKGTHPMLEQAYTPMTIRFFTLQAHYRSTVDFSNAALQGAEKALEKMTETYKRLQHLAAAEKQSVELPDFMTRAYEAMDDDLNTPQVIAVLFEAAKYVNEAADGKIALTAEQLSSLRLLFDVFLVQLLGIRMAETGGDEKATKALGGAMDLLLQIRAKAKAEKDWATSDLIRDELSRLGFSIKDTKNGAEWSIK